MKMEEKLKKKGRENMVKNKNILTVDRVDNLHIKTLLTTDKKNYEIYGDKINNIVYNKTADILNIETNNVATALQSIKRYHPLRVITHNKEIYQALKYSNLYTIFHTYYQCGITKDILTYTPKNLIFNKPLNFEVQCVTRLYPHLDESDIRQLVNNNKLFSVIENTEPIGYVGERIDGSIGMLYVFENLREMGYGKALFAQFTDKLLEDRDVVFTAINCNDIAMVMLLSDIGYSISNNEMYLLCNKEY